MVCLLISLSKKTKRESGYGVVAPSLEKNDEE
jgi:hypothetical protein